MIAEAISAAMVMSVLYKVEPNSPHVPKYGEISEAIATASNQDPLFPERVDGCARTAAILIALAWHESRFHANIVGDNGKSFGLYQIQPPTAGVEAKLLLLPKTASFIAIDLIRKSFTACRERSEFERLSWYVASNGCPTHPIIVKKSMDRLLYADRLFKQHFHLPPKK